MGCTGSVWPGAVNERLKCRLPEADHDTLAGLVIETMGRLPEKGDTMDVVGWVTLDNKSGKVFDAAEIKLIAGDVSKLQEDDGYRRERIAGCRTRGEQPEAGHPAWQSR